MTVTLGIMQLAIYLPFPRVILSRREFVGYLKVASENKEYTNVYF